MDLNKKFYILDNFITSNKHILERGYNEWDSSKIFFQLSIEHAHNSPLTQDAQKFKEDGKVDFDYLLDVNRREKYIINPLVDVIKLNETIVYIDVDDSKLIVHTNKSTIYLDRRSFEVLDTVDCVKVFNNSRLELDNVESHKFYIPLKNDDLFCYGSLVDRDVIIRDAKTLEEKTTIKGHGGNPVYIQELSNGDIATVSYQRAFKVLRDYKEIYKIDELHNDEVLGFYYDEDTNELFTYAKDKTVKKFKVDISTNTLEQENLKNMAICNDFEKYVLISGIGLNKIDRDTYKIVDSYMEHSVPFSSITKIDEKHFAAATFDRKIFIFSIDNFDVVDVLEFFNEKTFIPQIKALKIDNKYIVFTPIGKTAYLLDENFNSTMVNKDDYKEQTKYESHKKVSHELVKLEDSKIIYKDAVWVSSKEIELQFIDEKRDVVCIKDGKKSIKFLKLVSS